MFDIKDNANVSGAKLNACPHFQQGNTECGVNYQGSSLALKFWKESDRLLGAEAEFGY